MKTSNKAPRFFIESVSKKNNGNGLDQEEILITDKKIIHQLQKVLRKNIDDEIFLLDGEGGEFFGTIKEVSKKEIVIKKIELKKNEKENFEDSFDFKKIILAPAILKKDNFELVVQKCTELGIKKIQPIISERTEKDNLNFERLEKISREASEQSEKIFLPEIFETKKLEEFLKEKSKKQNINIFALQFNSSKIESDEIKKMTSQNSIEEIIFLVGPEGGWGEGDLEIFEKFDVEKISLGKQILRSETASISLSALLFI